MTQNTDNLTGAHTQREMGADPASAGKVRAIAETAIRDCEAGAPISAANLARDVLAALEPAAQPPEDLWFTDAQLPVLAMSGDAEDSRVLRVHFRRDVTKRDRDDLIAAMNLYAHPATPAPVEAGLADQGEAIARVMRRLADQGVCAPHQYKVAAGIIDDLVSALRAQSAPVAGPSQAALDVLAERQRQISKEGWTPEHDDRHDRGEMAAAAACYIWPVHYMGNPEPENWPTGWDRSWWKPRSRRENLVRGVALGLAEIERIDRAAPVAGEGGEG